MLAFSCGQSKRNHVGAEDLTVLAHRSGSRSGLPRRHGICSKMISDSSESELFMLLVEKRETDESLAGSYSKEDCSMQLKGTARFSFGRLVSLRAAHVIALFGALFSFTSHAQPKIVLSDLFTKTNL